MSKQRKMTLAEIERSNPLRKPTWRIQRAHAIVRDHNGNCNSLLDDAITKECVRYLEQRNKLATEPHVTRPSKPCFSHLQHVVELFLDQQFRPLRAEIEARILARQSDHDIAAATGCPASMIGLYEQVCCNIRDRLNCQDYILCWLLGNEFWQHPYQFKLERQLKYFAYIGGPRVLEIMLFCMRATGNSRQRVLQYLANSINEPIPKLGSACDINVQTSVIPFREFLTAMEHSSHSPDQGQTRKAS